MLRQALLSCLFFCALVGCVPGPSRADTGYWIRGTVGARPLDHEGYGITELDDPSSRWSRGLTLGVKVGNGTRWGLGLQRVPGNQQAHERLSMTFVFADAIVPLRRGHAADLALEGRFGWFRSVADVPLHISAQLPGASSASGNAPFGELRAVVSRELYPWVEIEAAFGFRYARIEGLTYLDGPNLESSAEPHPVISSTGFTASIGISILIPNPAG